MTAATVGGVHNAEDNVFTTTVATSGSLPEHMLVNQVQLCQQSNTEELPLQILLKSSFVLETKLAWIKTELSNKTKAKLISYT